MRRTVTALLLALVSALTLVPALHADDGKKIQIQGGDTMKYDITALDATAGQKVTLTMTNSGKLPAVAMAHNFVLLKAGADVTAYASAAMTHQAEGYLPPDQADKVIIATKLLGPGESDTITFTAPAAGTYDFICTFPGHAMAGMRGTLTVK